MNRHQHATNNDVLGAPLGVPVDECNALPITRIQYSDGTLAVVSYWRPTPDELMLLGRGNAVRLTVLGTTHSPLMLGVDGDGVL